MKNHFSCDAVIEYAAADALVCNHEYRGSGAVGDSSFNLIPGSREDVVRFALVSGRAPYLMAKFQLWIAEDIYVSGSSSTKSAAHGGGSLLPDAQTRTSGNMPAFPATSSFGKPACEPGRRTTGQGWQVSTHVVVDGGGLSVLSRVGNF